MIIGSLPSPRSTARAATLAPQVTGSIVTRWVRLSIRNPVFWFSASVIDSTVTRCVLRYV